MKGIKICKTCAQIGRQKTLHFFCQNDSLIHPENVDFLCNICQSGELIYKEGVYICPQCFNTPDAFRCRLCNSTKVEVLDNQLSPK